MLGVLRAFSSSLVFSDGAVSSLAFGSLTSGRSGGELEGQAVVCFFFFFFTHSQNTCSME